MKGCREDDRVCPFHDTQTRKCLNPFCGFSFAVPFEDIRFARMVGCISSCPKCGYEESKVIHMQFRLVGGSKEKGCAK